MKSLRMSEPDGGSHAFDRHKVFDREGKPVQRTARFSTSDLRVLQLRFSQQIVPTAQRHDGIHQRVDALDVIEIGGHHLDARHLARADRLREYPGTHHDDG